MRNFLAVIAVVCSSGVAFAQQSQNPMSYEALAKAKPGAKAAIGHARCAWMNDGCWYTYPIDLVAGCDCKAERIDGFPFQVSFFDAVGCTKILKLRNNTFGVAASQ